MSENPHVAVCPGSYDPVHRGHLDVITRASDRFDEVVVAIGVNASKRRMFSDAERIELLTTACADLSNVRVDGFDGLVTDYCRGIGASTIVKGLRGPGDLDYEAQMAQMNRHITAGGVDTTFLVTDARYSFVSSSLVKEVIGLGGDVSELVPGHVLEALKAKLSERTDR